jgi:putative flippase GtrA
VSESARWQAFIRWIKFNLVGAIGIVVQIAALWCLTAFGMGYMVATALAVEAAVLNNFVWHERFTWRDRAGGRSREAAIRLLRFNLSNGAVSIGGNLVLMGLLVGEAHLRPLVANLISIAACSLVNFVVSDRWVFRGAASPSIPAA